MASNKGKEYAGGTIPPSGGGGFDGGGPSILISLRSAPLSAPLSAPRTESTPKRLTLTSLIAEGGCCRVYKGRFNKVNESTAPEKYSGDCAVKVFSRSYPAYPNDSFQQDYKKEKEVLRRLCSSENIVKAYEFDNECEEWDTDWDTERDSVIPEVCREEGDLLLPLELMEEDLVSLIEKRYPQGLPTGLAARVFSQVLQGVCDLHGSGNSHTDLKPCAVLLSGKLVKGLGDTGEAIPVIKLPTVKLCDFGSSETLRLRLAPQNGIGTTPGHVPPELAPGHFSSRTRRNTEKVLSKAAKSLKNCAPEQTPVHAASKATERTRR